MVLPDVQSKLTHEEAALYDRQIRCWGLDAQNRLKSSSVLLIGMSGLGAEVAKNLMLSGLKSLTIVDDQTVNDDDLSTNFLLEHGTALNQNRAAGSLKRCQQLNPLVLVDIVTDSIWQKIGELIASRNYNLVCCVDQTIEDSIRVNEMCRRQQDVLFCAGAVHGYYGYSFNDFGDEFHFAEEVLANKMCEGSQNCSNNDLHVVDENQSVIEKIPEKKQQDDKDKIVVRLTMSFRSLADIYNSFAINTGGSDQSLANNQPRFKRLPAGYRLFQIIASFQSMYKRNPSLNSRQEDVRSLTLERNRMISEMGGTKLNIPEDFADTLFGQFPAVNAIVGGVLAQEVLKGISQFDQPFNNMFFYNPFDFVGAVARFPKE